MRNYILYTILQMKFTCALSLTATLALAHVMTPEDFEFIGFVSEYGKSYNTVEEFEMRSLVFKKNLHAIKAYKSETSTVGVNQFTDLTVQEYKAMLGYRAADKEFQLQDIAVRHSTNSKTEVDWVSAGAVTPVKDQA